MKFGFALLACSLPAAAATCESLAKLPLPATAIRIAEAQPAGSFTPPWGKPIGNLPAFCRIAGVLKPSADSNIEFEVWMPASGWNGKFQGIGNGGFAGVIGYPQMANAISHGYATAGTDTGHHGAGDPDTQALDASWALGHREKVVDFGYRAIHETTENAKAIVRAFYGEAPKRSYFSSCSNGGRQALMEAQRYPADYDGIIAGAPANYWTRLLVAVVWNMQAISDPASYIPASKLPAIEAAALAACDANDGVKDDLIGDPSKCRFDPAKLLCKGTESDACLTAPQIAALKKIYSGPRTSKGEQLIAGFPPGGETGPGGWAGWVTGFGDTKSLQYTFGTQFFQNMVFEDPTWDFKAFNIDRDLKIADDKVGSILNASDADLRRFKQRGGKLILYHGWSDAAIPAGSSVDYYQSVVSKMGAQNAGSFVRLFMVPGMKHCGNGPGPNAFGQQGVAQGDPLHNISAALEHWVEDGVAPEQIIAAKYKGAGPASGIARTRPLCAYPMVAKWKGSGSTDDAANFTCVKP